MEKQNANPTVYATSRTKNNHNNNNGSELSDVDILANIIDEEEYEPVTSQEIFELITDIQDPEHPLTLEVV